MWDPEAPFTVREDDLLFRHKVSPYIGRRLEGRVVETWLRGRRIYERGGHVGEPQGRPLLHRGAS